MTETDQEITGLDALMDKLKVLRREIRDEYFIPSFTNKVTHGWDGAEERDGGSKTQTWNA